MIGKLSGIIDFFDTSSLILDVGGVGYVISASSRTLSSIGQVGDTASLLITTNVREDAITLYGFADALEKQWFALLTSVQGVGAKAAMAILAACPADQLSFAIAGQDKAVLTQASGVGPKLATRILTELKDKAGKIDVSVGAKIKNNETDTNDATVQVSESYGVDQDAVSALTNLGYSSMDAYRAVLKAQEKINDGNEEKNLQSIIRIALQELSS